MIGGEVAIMATLASACKHIFTPRSVITAEFDDSEEDSQIEVVLEEVDGGTMVILRHTNLPPNGGHYQQGWIDHYLDPMKEYFSGQP